LKGEASSSGELEITDAIQLMLEYNYKIGYEILDG
jgi:dTDP-glucose pyrophosphorylase